jgi:hypothetical protein
MDNEMVGGECTIYCKMKNTEGKEMEKSVKFKIRGMNPPDANVEAYAKFEMPDFCRDYAWAILRHESTDGNYVYCQFNAQENKLKGLTNKTTDTKDDNGKPVKQWGWGISQQDKGALDNPKNTDYVTTAEMYNWRTNIGSAVKKIVASRATHNRFMGYFKATYGNSVEPPTEMPYEIGGLTMTTEQFAVIVLYNGADKKTIPRSDVWKGNYEADGKTKKFEAIWSPVTFNPTGNGEWAFHDNKYGYAARIAAELQDTKPKPE